MSEHAAFKTQPFTFTGGKKSIAELMIGANKGGKIVIGPLGDGRNDWAATFEVVYGGEAVVRAASKARRVHYVARLYMKLVLDCELDPAHTYNEMRENIEEFHSLTDDTLNAILCDDAELDIHYDCEAA